MVDMNHCGSVELQRKIQSHYYTGLCTDLELVESIDVICWTDSVQTP